MRLQIATIYHTFLEIYYVVYHNSHKNIPTLTLLPGNLPGMEEILRGWALFHETIVNVIIPSTIQLAVQIRQWMHEDAIVYVTVDL